MNITLATSMTIAVSYDYIHYVDYVYDSAYDYVYRCNRYHDYD